MAEESQNPAEQSSKMDESVQFIGDRNAILFNAEAGEPLPPLDLPDDFFELDKDDARILFKELKENREMMENAPFRTKAVRDMEESMAMLQRLNRYTKTVLRVQFPDRLVLQAVFNHSDTIQTVMDFLHQFLDPSDVQFQLYTAPPKCVLKPETTMVEAKLTPRALIYFGAVVPQDQTTFLKTSLLSRLTSPKLASEAALHYRGSQRKMTKQKQTLYEDTPHNVSYAGDHNKKLPSGSKDYNIYDLVKNRKLLSRIKDIANSQIEKKLKTKIICTKVKKNKKNNPKNTQSLPKSKKSEQRITHRIKTDNRAKVVNQKEVIGKRSLNTIDQSKSRVIRTRNFVDEMIKNKDKIRVKAKEKAGVTKPIIVKRNIIKNEKVTKRIPKPPKPQETKPGPVKASRKVKKQTTTAQSKTEGRTQRTIKRKLILSSEPACKKFKTSTGTKVRKSQLEGQNKTNVKTKPTETAVKPKSSKSVKESRHTKKKVAALNQNTEPKLRKLRKRNSSTSSRRIQKK